MALDVHYSRAGGIRSVIVLRERKGRFIPSAARERLAEMLGGEALDEPGACVRAGDLAGARAAAATLAPFWDTAARVQGQAGFFGKRSGPPAPWTMRRPQGCCYTRFA